MTFGFSFPRAVPLIKPRTEGDCQPVAFLMASSVAPPGCLRRDNRIGSVAAVTALRFSLSTAGVMRGEGNLIFLAKFLNPKGLWSGCRDLNAEPLALQATNINHLQTTLNENTRFRAT
jgi:hypothetical protein